MNVDITMAAKDLFNTEGLCGFMDGNSQNDLLHKNGSVSTPLSTDINIYERKYDAFTESWRLVLQDILAIT